MRRLLTIAVVLVVLVSSLAVVTLGRPLAASPTPSRQNNRGSADSDPSTTVTGANWPTYLYNVERTGANLEEDTLSPDNVSALQPIWSIPSNGSDFSAPIVVNGTVFFGSWNGTEEAVNATTGAVEWATFIGTDSTCGVFNPMGVSSTPAYWNGTLYLGGGDGYWYALNAKTGAVEWRYIAPWETKFYYNWASALVYRGSLYAGLSSCLDNPLVPAGLLKLNISGGVPTLSAVFNTTPPGVDGDSIWSSPSLDPQTNTVWVTTGNENSSTDPYYPKYANSIIALNATDLNVSGSWQVPNVIGLDSDFGATPTIFTTPSGQALVVATDKNGYTYAFNRSNVSADGSWGPKWTLYTAGGYGGAAYDGQTLFLGGQYGLGVYAVDPDTGGIVWNTPLAGGAVLGALAWADGVVYAAAGSVVYALDAANGSILWNYQVPGGQSVVTEPVVANGRLYVTSGDYGADGTLTVFGLPHSSVLTTFTETGLPYGATWSVTMNGTTHDSQSSLITFVEPNGSYEYTVAVPFGFGASPDAGLVLVKGSSQVLGVTLAAIDGAAAVAELSAIYSHRPDLRAIYPNAFGNSTSYTGLVSWAGEVVTGETDDSAYSSLVPFGYWYALMATYNGRPDLQSTYPDAFTNLTVFTKLVTWAGLVVEGRVVDSDSATLAPFGYWYALMATYNGRPDLQSTYPDAFTNLTVFTKLVTWAGLVVEGRVVDSDNATLAPFGYWYALMATYNGRPDLQSAYPDAFTDIISYTRLVTWASHVVAAVWPDSAYSTLVPFGYWYALMGVYNTQTALQAVFPLAFSDGFSYQGLLNWARAVVMGEIPSPEYATLEPFATYYEELG